MVLGEQKSNASISDRKNVADKQTKRYDGPEFSDYFGTPTRLQKTARNVGIKLD
jgi:hypothetical protein